MKTVSFEPLQSMQLKNITARPQAKATGSGLPFAALLASEMQADIQDGPVRYAASALSSASALSDAAAAPESTATDTPPGKFTDTIDDTPSERESLKNILLMLCAMMFSNATNGSEGNSGMGSSMMMGLLQAFTGLSDSGKTTVNALSSLYAGSSGGASGLQSGTGGQAVVDAALTRLGDPYSMAKRGTGEYVDCSYLTKWAYAKTGVSLPATSVAQAKYCYDNGYTVSREELKPGDLVFWTKSSCHCGRWNEIHHVGIYAGNNKVVEARSSKGEVVLDDLWGEDGGNWRVAMYARPRAAG
jgi:cell wall-associated NlpC family hydrolase